MDHKIMQCCYTNATNNTGDVVSSGWQAVAVSPELPETAYSNCTRMQNINSSIQGKMIDEDGNALNLLEIFGDGSFLYFCRTQYGLTDRLGRANMFSHALIMPCRDTSFINDPNNYLTIARESFVSTEETAKNALSNIVRSVKYDLEESLKKCGICDDNYRMLIKCVYAKFVDRSSIEPLYIQYNGDESEMMELLFCIYSALPLSVRRKLSVASCETRNTSGKNIIFSKYAKNKNAYCIPRTGETNVLTQRIERKLERLGFVDYVAKYHRSLDEPEYFKNLEDTAVTLGDSSASNELVMKIAHYMNLGVNYSTICGEKLDEMLSDAIRSNTLGNEAMDAHIAELLNAVRASNQWLTEENKSYLTDRIQNTASQQLKQSAEMYHREYFEHLSRVEQIEMLSDMPESDFNEYHDWLSQFEEGCEVLDEYYSEKLTENAVWEDLKAILNWTSELLQRPKVIETVSEKAKTLLLQQLDDCLDPNLAVSIIRDYSETMTGVLKDAGIKRTIDAAKDSFWKEMPKLSMFDFCYFEQYRQYLSSDLDYTNTAFKYCELPLIYSAIGELKFFRQTYTVFNYYGRSQKDAREINAAKHKLINEITAGNPSISESFAKWFELFADVPNKNLADVLGDVYSAVQHQDYRKIYDSIRKIKKNEGNASEALISKLFDLVKQTWLKRESYSNYVPLDVWLSLSKALASDYFAFLDNAPIPIVLKLDPQKVACECDIIKNEEWRKDAEQYVKQRGPYSDIVYKWTEYSQLERESQHSLVVEEKRSREPEYSTHSRDKGRTKQFPKDKLAGSPKFRKKRGVAGIFDRIIQAFSRKRKR